MYYFRGGSKPCNCPHLLLPQEDTQYNILLELTRHIWNRESIKKKNRKKTKQKKHYSGPKKKMSYPKCFNYHQASAQPEHLQSMGVYHSLILFRFTVRHSEQIHQTSEQVTSLLRAIKINTNTVQFLYLQLTWQNVFGLCTTIPQPHLARPFTNKLLKTVDS